MSLTKGTLILAGLLLLVAGAYSSSCTRAGDASKKGYIGLTGFIGYVVDQVAAGSPAERAGIHPGDVIVYVDGHRVTSMEAMTQEMAEVSVEESLELRILRYDPDTHRFKTAVVRIQASNAKAPRD